MRTTFVGAAVLLPEGIRTGLYLTVLNGRIEALSPALPDNPGEVIRADGLVLCPGLIDLHVHGGGGHDFMDGTAEAFVKAAQAHLPGGTTTLLPTTVCCSFDETKRALAALRSARGLPVPLPHMPGLHLEGPWLNPVQAGAQDPAFITLPNEEEIAWVLENAHDIARLTAAPEVAGALEAGRRISACGVLVSIGHSDADLATVREAVGHGYTHVTHLYSGMSSLKRVRAMRVLGVLESAYLLDELTVEIIADGVHLPPELLRLILKCKPHAAISLVTDATMGAGLPEGSVIRLGSREAGREAVIEHGVAYVPDRTAFAGSVATADRCVRTMVQEAGLTLAEAVPMMTANPAAVLGIGHQKGALLPGMDADLVLLDGDVNVEAVYVMGRLAARRGAVVENA